MLKPFFVISAIIVLGFGSLFLLDMNQTKTPHSKSNGLHQIAGALEAYKSKSLRPGAPPAAIQERALQAQNAEGHAVIKLTQGLMAQAQTPSTQKDPTTANSPSQPELVLTAVVDPLSVRYRNPQDDERMAKIMNSPISNEVKKHIYQKYKETGILPELQWVAQPTPASRAPAFSDDPYDPRNW